MSSFLSLLGKAHLPFMYAYRITTNSFLFGAPETQKQRFLPIENNPTLEQWNEFTSKFPEGNSVKLLHGFSRNYAGSLGTFLFKNSPKLVVVDICLESLDPQAAMWLCKREFAHINHSDVLKEQTALLVSSIATSFFSECWYSPLLVGVATHVIAEKTFGLYTETRADDLAIQHSTEEELKGAIRFFEASIQAERELCLSHPFFNKSVKFIKELTGKSPYNHVRLAKIEKSLQSRFNYDLEKLGKIKTDNRIQKLKQYILFKNSIFLEDPQYKNKTIGFLQSLGSNANKTIRIIQNLEYNLDPQKSFL